MLNLQYGDCGKGKIAHALCRERKYTHVIRYNGGCNAGHTIYHNGQKFVTHHIPRGVFFGIKSIIGPGCVVHVDTFLREIEELEQAGIPAKKLVHVATNAHLITDFTEPRMVKTKRLELPREATVLLIVINMAEKVLGKDDPNCNPT